MIKQAKKEDVPEIIAVQKLAFYDVAKYYNNFRLRPLQTTIEEMEESFSSYIYFKKIIDNSIVGSVRVKVLDNKGHIENVIVHPDFQNRGIGKELIGNLENILIDCNSFELFTGKDTPKNVTFYEKLGYKIISEKAASENDPIFVIMEKQTGE